MKLPYFILKSQMDYKSSLTSLDGIFMTRRINNNKHDKFKNLKTLSSESSYSPV